MSFELRELQDSARKVVDGLGVAANESELWSQIVELGWLMVPVPESLSGLDVGAQGACAMQCELGRGLSTAPYLPALLAVEAICQSDNIDRDAWLERVFGGELITAPLAECAIAVESGIASGRAVALQSADTAAFMLLWSEKSSTVALIDTKKSGVTVKHRETWDQTRRLFDVELQSIPLHDHTVLAEGESALSLIEKIRALRDFYLAAESIGSAQALLDLTVEHLQTRIQFKRPLALFQALKHRCADMKASIVAAEAMLYDALSQVEASADNLEWSVKAKGAKMFATTMFARVAEDCLQLHGGIGMADEHPCHLYLKRSLLSEQLSASNSSNALHLAMNLLENADKARLHKSP